LSRASSLRSSQQSYWQRFKVVIPNALTTLRLLLIFPYAHYLLIGDRYAAAIVFFIATVSDIDGTVARKIGAASKFGSFYDPIVDAMLLLTAAVLLLTQGSLALWAVAIYSVSVVFKLIPLRAHYQKHNAVKNSFISKAIAFTASYFVAFLGTLSVSTTITSTLLVIGAVGNIGLSLLWLKPKRS
jgi:cardiolipin synthase (CMP-forming)